MNKSVLLIVGVLATIFGAIFTFQGLGYLEGSPMTDEPFWAIAGPIIAGLGVAMLIVSRPKR